MVSGCDSHPSTSVHLSPSIDPPFVLPLPMHPFIPLVILAIPLSYILTLSHPLFIQSRSCIHPSSLSSIYPANLLSIHLSTYPLIPLCGIGYFIRDYHHPCTHPSFHSSIHLSTHPPIHLSSHITVSYYKEMFCVLTGYMQSVYV